MNEVKYKLFSVGKILLMLIFCLIISICIYLGSFIFAFGVWHCPAGNCHTPLWADLTIFMLWMSPFLVFAAGAYICRDPVYELTDNKYARVSMLLAFTLFPLWVFAGFIVYAIISRN